MQSWAGQLECSSGECKGRNLLASEFSKTALDNHRRYGKKLKCKKCVQVAAEKERMIAAASTDNICCLNTVHECSSCKKTLLVTAFTKNQLNKGLGVQRCHACVETAENCIAKEPDIHKRLEESKAVMQKAEKSGTVLDRLFASSAISALEAELVTGVKPRRLSKKKT